MSAHCPDTYADTGACLDACAEMPQDGEIGDEAGDTLQCRITQSQRAEESPARCAAAGPDGAGTCDLPPAEITEPDDRASATALRFNRFGVAAATVTLDPEGDTDWLALELAAAQDLAVEISDLSGGLCGGELIARVYIDEAEAPSAEAEGCPALYPAAVPALRGVPTGRHLIALTSDVTVGPLQVTVRQVSPLPVDAPCEGAQAACVAGAYCGEAGLCQLNVCGDGVVYGDEACDDGNADEGDGCEACEIRPLAIGQPCDPEDDIYICDAFIAYCVADEAGDDRCLRHRCGDGVIGPREQCEDGNNQGGDGCEVCQIVGIPIGRACDPQSYPCVDIAYCAVDACVAHACGDSVIGPEEECDEPNARCQGCLVESELPRQVEPDSQEAPTPLIFDEAGQSEILFQFKPAGDEDWFSFSLDGYANVTASTQSFTGAGCEGDTVMEILDAEGARRALNDDGGPDAPCSLISPATDGAAAQLPPGDYLIHLRAFSPQARAMNRLQVIVRPKDVGDACALEDVADPCPPHAYCDPEGLICAPHVCGDGRQGPDEGCDDGNDDDLDGCTTECALRPIALGDPCYPRGLPCVAEGYCPEDTRLCTAHVCGDGVVAPDEGCDDGNDNELDGCTAQCEIAPIPEGQPCDPWSEIFVCEGALFCRDGEGGPVCAQIMCGDGFTSPGEVCDPEEDVPGAPLCTEQCSYSPFHDDVEPDSAEAPWVVEFGPDRRFDIVNHIPQVGDEDWFRITLPTTADLYIETRSALQRGNRCEGDLEAWLFHPDDLENRIIRDDDSIGLCPRISPGQYRMVQAMAPDDYLIRINELRNNSFAGYNLISIWYVPYVGLGEACGAGEALCEAGLTCGEAAVCEAPAP